jgi:putative oxidoreductase
MITNFLEKYKNAGLLIIRVGMGVAYTFVYGWGKITGGTELWLKLGAAMGNVGITFAPEFWGFMASLSEFGGGILILIGLFTRPAAFFMAFTMLMATLQHLSKLDPWNRVMSPMENFAVLIGLVFLGAGRYSLDYLFFKRKKELPIVTSQTLITGKPTTANP